MSPGKSIAANGTADCSPHLLPDSVWVAHASERDIEWELSYLKRIAVMRKPCIVSLISGTD